MREKMQLIRIARSLIHRAAEHITADHMLLDCCSLCGTVLLQYCTPAKKTDERGVETAMLTAPAAPATAHLHWASCVLDAADRGGASAAVVAADLDHIRVCLGHTRRDNTNAGLCHQLD